MYLKFTALGLCLVLYHITITLGATTTTSNEPTSGIPTTSPVATTTEETMMSSEATTESQASTLPPSDICNKTYCFCDKNESFVIRCTGLSEIPDNLPRDVNVLSLTHGTITHIDKELARLSDLQVLNLYNNTISKISDDAFQSQSQLYYLNVGKNYLDLRSLSWLIGNVTQSLEHLDLSYNTLRIIKNNTFNKLNKLKYLNLTHLFDSIESQGFNGLDSLLGLDLSMNNISSQDLESTFSLTGLASLNISGAAITSLAERIFNRLVNIQTLIVNNCKFLTEIEANSLASLTNLKTLSLRDNVMLSVIHPMSFNGSLNTMTKIDLSRNNLSTIDEVLLNWETVNDTLDISNNPWNCTCTLQFFIPLMESSPKIFKHINYTKCTMPDTVQNKTFLDAKKDVFNCHNHTSHVLVLAIGFSVALIAVFTAVLVCAICKSKGRTRHMMRRLSLTPLEDDEVVFTATGSQMAMMTEEA